MLKNIEEYPIQVTLYLLRSIARMDGGILSKSLPHPLRLEICQKIYTTKFSGERILHTENA